MKKVKPFSREQVKECPITEGRTYLAEILIDPWKGYPKHKSLVGKLVKVTSYNAVIVHWPSTQTNSFARSSVRVIGECEP